MSLQQQTACREQNQRLEKDRQKLNSPVFSLFFGLASPYFFQIGRDGATFSRFALATGRFFQSWTILRTAFELTVIFHPNLKQFLPKMPLKRTVFVSRRVRTRGKQAMIDRRFQAARRAKCHCGRAVCALRKRVFVLEAAAFASNRLVIV